MNVNNGGSLIVRTLAAAGVDTLFALHGAHIDAIFQAAAAHGVRLIDMRHEAAAGHAAEGHARSTRRLGVAAVTAGAGFTNVLSSMANAMTDRTPVLYIAGAPPLGAVETNTLQGGVDQVAMAKPLTKWAQQANRVEDIPRLVAHAIRIATAAPTGPVFLNVPMDLMMTRVNDDERVEIPASFIVEAGRAPTDEWIDRALALLAEAKRPVLMIGADAWRDGAGSTLKAFAETTGIPVFAEFGALGLLPSSHALNGGTFHKLAYFGDERPDAVLAVGVRFGLFTLGSADALLAPGAKLIHVEVDAAELGRLRHADMATVADPQATLAKLHGRAGLKAWRRDGAWPRIVQQAKAARRELLQREAGAPSWPLHPYHAVAAIAEAAPADAIVVADGAEGYHWLNETIRPERPGSYLTHGHFGCMGIGLGLAIGAQAAHRERPVLLMAGDGAIGLNLIEFETMARHRLPIVTVVMNNRSWGASQRFQEVVVGADGVRGTRLSAARYADAARALGCEGQTIDDVAELGPAISAAFKNRQPTCIDLHVADQPAPPELLLMMKTA